MVTKLSEVQFGLKSYAWFQNPTSAQREFDLKSQVPRFAGKEETNVTLKVRKLLENRYGSDKFPRPPNVIYLKNIEPYCDKRHGFDVISWKKSGSHCEQNGITLIGD